MQWVDQGGLTNAKFALDRQIRYLGVAERGRRRVKDPERIITLLDPTQGHCRAVL